MATTLLKPSQTVSADGVEDDATEVVRLSNMVTPEEVKEDFLAHSSL